MANVRTRREPQRRARASANRSSDAPVIGCRTTTPRRRRHDHTPIFTRGVYEGSDDRSVARDPLRRDPRTRPRVAVQPFVGAGRSVGQHGRLARRAQPGRREDDRARTRPAGPGARTPLAPHSIAWRGPWPEPSPRRHRAGAPPDPPVAPSNAGWPTRSDVRGPSGSGAAKRTEAPSGSRRGTAGRTSCTSSTFGRRARRACRAASSSNRRTGTSVAPRPVVARRE
jgi:hypothetical protein